MANSPKQRPTNLGELEQLVMDHIWNRGPSTAEQCREALRQRHPMKDSTARTVLRRLEEKGILRHSVEGRTYLYRAVQERRNIAARAIRQILDRFCGGSVEQLLVGMVEDEVFDRAELQRLAQKIAEKKNSRS
jgi:BlaI family transcriptional regulator, penicillinase repressor